MVVDANLDNWNKENCPPEPTFIIMPPSTSVERTRALSPAHPADENVVAVKQIVGFWTQSAAAAKVSPFRKCGNAAKPAVFGLRQPTSHGVSFGNN